MEKEKGEKSESRWGCNLLIPESNASDRTVILSPHGYFRINGSGGIQYSLYSTHCTLLSVTDLYSDMAESRVASRES